MRSAPTSRNGWRQWNFGALIATTRQPEATLRHEWQQALPGILGGLLDLAATVHQRLETISVDEPPRMADYGRTLAAVDEALASNA